MADQHESISTTQQRVVRVFVSSTFQDMYDEREELIKFTFPEIRKRCKERNVEFVEVDLRWGVTDEQKAEGKVLPICLAEIERCRPYFIGLLGERYGWVPGEIDKELSEVQPWLKEHKEKSVTELEIVHGVLKNPKMKKLAFFYFRSPETSNQIEKDISQKPAYQPEPEPSLNKLKSLKEEIRKSGYPVRKDYPNTKTLGKLVLDDLWEIIDKKFPKEEVPSAIERERMEHETFAKARRKVYIGRDEYFKKLDEHAVGEGPPLVLLGESGSGKSALIANWAKKYREKHPDDFMVLHFIGSTPDSTDYVHILRRIMEEIKEKYEPESKEGTSDQAISSISTAGEEEKIPTDPKKVVEVFPLWLAKAIAKGRFILILDALNQLEDKGNAPELGWLPKYFPPNIHVVLSTLPGRSLEALNKRNWQTLTVQPIDIDERKEFIEKYLEQYRKKLDKKQTVRVASAEQAANPLYLRTLLEELRIFGIHEELDNRINGYLRANTVDDLFEIVFERLEQDYERDKAELVQDVMSLIWASRRGLSETELLELLDVPPAIWSPLYLAIEGHLISRSGLLNFSHHFLRKAVEHKYLNNTELKRIEHLQLADYFEKRELDDRKVDELPWQLAEAKEWKRLKDCITNINIFDLLTTEGKYYELSGYWLAIEDRFDIVEAYLTMIKKHGMVTTPDKSVYFLPSLQSLLNKVAELFKLDARYKEAEALYRLCLAIYEKIQGQEHSYTAATLNNLAELLDKKGDHEGAEPLFRRALAIWEKVLGPEHIVITKSLSGLAAQLCNKGDYEGAEPLFRRALAISEKVRGPEHPGTAIDLCNLASLLKSKGDYKGAEPLYRRALVIYENMKGQKHPNTAFILIVLADLLDKKGDYEGAEPLYRRALVIHENMLRREHPDTARNLNRLAEILEKKGDYEEAESLYRRALAISEKVLGPEHSDTAKNLFGLAVLLYKKGDYKKAEQIYHRSLGIFLKKHPEKTRIFNGLADLFYKKDDHEGAEHSFRKALAIYEKVWPEDPGTAELLSGLAALLYKKGDYEGSESFYRRALAIREKVLGEHPDTAVILNSLAYLLDNKGDYEGSESFYRRALAIREKVLGEHLDTTKSLNGLALLLCKKGDYKGAELLFRRVLAIYEKVLGKDHPDTVSSLNSLAYLLDNMGDHEGAESLYRRALAIREKILGKDHPYTATSLNNLALLLYKKGDYEGAEPLFRKALAIYEKVLGKDHPDTVSSLKNLEVLLYKKGENEEAELLYWRRILAIREKVLGPDHPDIATCLYNLAVLFWEKGDYERAEPLHRRALAIREKVLGKEDPLTAASLNGLALLLNDKGDYERAEQLSRRALNIREKVLGPEHSYTALNLNSLAKILMKRGKYDEAESLCGRALAIREKVLGPEHPDTITTRNNLEAIIKNKGS